MIEPTATVLRGDEWPFPIAVVTHGDVPAADRERASEKIARVSEEIHTPVLFARVTLTHHADPAASAAATVHAVLDVGGVPVHARASADTIGEAIDMMVDRMSDRLHAGRLWDREEGVPAVPGRWRHTNLATQRPRWFNRPVDEREIVRRKGIGGQRATIEEAMFDMHLGDYDFYLFVDEHSGLDSLLVRQSGEHDEVRVSEPSRVDVATLPAGVRLSPAPASHMAETDAVEWLNVTDDPFVFFVDIVTNRGAVLYRRLDGHYGSIAPDVGQAR